MKIVYFSVTGQTKRFIKKAEITDALEITPLDPFIRMEEPFILITPTYEEEITEPVFDFLRYEDNKDYFRGVVGTGNRNFAELFIFTAKDIVAEFHVPLLQAFEFAGTHYDIKKFKEVVSELESKELN